MARAGECDRCVEGFTEVTGIFGDGRRWFRLGTCDCWQGRFARARWRLNLAYEQSRTRHPSGWPQPPSP